MPLTINWYTHVIEITSPTVSVAGQVLHDFIEDIMATPTGMLYNDIISPEGKIEDPSNPGVFSQIIIILNSPWQIQFWQGSGYTRIYGAKLVGGLSDEPIKATGAAGDVTVLESPVDGVTVVSGSGVTEQDKDDIADKVWDVSEAVKLITDMASVLGNTEFIEAMEGGRWKIDKVTKQMTFYKADNITEITKFNLYNSNGVLAYEDVFERMRVTTTTTTSTTTTSTTTTTTTTTV